MTTPDTSPAVRPPVLLGCTAVVAAVVLVVLFGIAAITFLESGANSGLLTLDPAESYAPGSVEYLGERNLFVVRLADGTFLALSDLDAANRRNPQRRCRVAPVPTTDPQLPALISRLASRMSPAAAGSTLLLRETCNAAIYDITGLRLDADGPNLDRYATTTDAQQRLRVDISKRTCSNRTVDSPSIPAPCPR